MICGKNILQTGYHIFGLLRISVHAILQSLFGFVHIELTICRRTIFVRKKAETKIELRHLQEEKASCESALSQ